MSNPIKKIALAALLVAAVFASSTPSASAVTIEELMAQIAALQSQLTTLEGGSSSAGGTSYNFTRDLTVGSTGDDVKALQEYLNANGAQVAVSGAGSPGSESTYFGNLTKAALAKWQAANGVSPASGYFGPLTRAKVASLSAVVVTPPPSPTPTPSGLPAGCTSTAGFSPTTGVKCDSTVTPPSPTPAPVPSGFAVTLSADNPAAGTLVAGQAIADLAHISFSNGGATDVKVTNVVLKRTGVSADSTLSSVYLFNAASRLTDSASVSSGKITFNNSAGLFTVPASSTVTLAVKANIATGTSGQTVGVMLDSYTKMGDSAATTASVSGNVHTIATATMAGVNFNATTTPAATTITAQADYTMWQNTVSITERDVWLKSLRFRQIGSINNVDLNNFRLYVDGIQVGSTVANLDANGYLTFDLMAAPVTLKTGSRIVKVVGDVVGGASRTFSLSLRETGDVHAVDSQYGQSILAQANSTTFSARDSGTQTIDTGTLTFTKRSDSPSGNIVDGATAAVLARYDVKAFGEAMKVESLRVRIDEGNNVTTGDDDTSGANSVYTLRNGAVYVDGVQVGSTAAIAGDGDATLAYTEYTFGSSFIVNPGKTVVLEVRADVFDNDGVNDLDATDTIQVEVLGSSNVQRLTSLGFVSLPGTAVEGNTLTVSTGSLTVAKNTAYGDRTIVAPKTAYKLGEYNVQASTTEGTNITSIQVDLNDTATDAFDASDDLTNLYITVGSYTSPIKATVVDDLNTFATNITVAAGQTVAVGVFADVASTATNGDATADTLATAITVAHTTLNSATSATETEVAGQTITFGAGTFATALDGASPLARIVAGNQTVEAARYKFTATNETYYLKQIQVKVSSATVATAVNSVELYDGTTLLGSAPLAQASNTAALITGLNVQVPANGTKSIIAKLVLNNIGTGAGTSQVNAALTLDSVLRADSQGVEATDGTDRAGNELFVFKSIPTITQTDLTNGKIINGSQAELYKFTVAANSSGNVALKQFKLVTTWNDGGAAGDTLEVEQLKLFEDGVDVTTLVTMQDEDGNSVESTSGMLESDGTLVVSWIAGQESVVSAGGSRTYSIRGTFQGFNVADATATPTDSVAFQFQGDSARQTASHTYVNGTATAATIWGLHDAAAATGSGEDHNLIWSDMSANPHATAENASSSVDWTNGYKVLNLDLGTEQFSNS